MQALLLLPVYTSMEYQIHRAQTESHPQTLLMRMRTLQKGRGTRL